MENLQEKLKRKGWSPEEIKHASSIVSNANVPSFHLLVPEIFYWTILSIAIFANIGFAYLILPLMFLKSALLFFFTVSLVSLVFGLLFLITLKEIETFSIKHKTIIFTIIPANALMSFTIIQNNLSQNFVEKGIPILLDPILTSLVYITFFLLPLLIYLVFKGVKHESI